MSDIDEIVEYLKCLKKGFDKDLFQSKIEDLAHLVDSSGLEYNDFHTLFKVWLNLSIPLTKWVSIGVCIVSQEVIKEQTVDYAFRWLLANFKNQNSFPRIAFLLDWLTAAMDSDSIEMATLDNGYEIFYTMLAFEVLTAQALKLVYTLTKPLDVTRRRVLEILDCAKKVENKKNMLRQLQVLLGLFKSYKPECVPEDVPAISIHTSFRKLNQTLVNRFRRSQALRNSMHKEGHHLLWMNPFRVENRNKKAVPLLPSLGFVNVGSKQYAAGETMKNHLDFTDAVSLLQHCSRAGLERPARLRALLSAEAGLALLATAPPTDLLFMQHQLQPLLHACFLDTSPYSYSEKRSLLSRLSLLQRSLLEPLPAVTRMLAQYLPLWNETDFFAEILELSEWVCAEPVELVTFVVEPLVRAFHRAPPPRQCALLRSLTALYTNLVYTSTRNENNLVCSQPSEESYTLTLSYVALSITDMCEKGLQVCPDDMRMLLGSLSASQRAAAAGRGRARGAGGAGPSVAGRGAGGVRPRVLPRRVTCALALLAPSAAAVDSMAALILQYKKIFKLSTDIEKDEEYYEQIRLLMGYTSDMIRCLFSEEALSGRHTGVVLDKISPNLLETIKETLPRADSSLSIRNHLAFAPYTYLQLEAIHHSEADNKLWFDTVINQEFEHLGAFLNNAFRSS